MITREGFYAGLESLREEVRIFRQIEDALGTDLGDSLVNDMLEASWDAFTNVVFGKDTTDEQIYEAIFEMPVSFVNTDDEGNIIPNSGGVLPYDKYYEFFVEGRLEDDWLE